MENFIMRELGYFLKLFRTQQCRMTVGLFLGVITVLASIGLLSLSGWFISASALAGLSGMGQLFNYFHPGTGLRIFAVTRTLGRYGERISNHDTTFRILSGLRIWFYQRIEPLAPARLMKYRSGDILNRITADIDALDNLYLRVLVPSAVALLIVTLLFVFLSRSSMTIAVAALFFFVSAGVLLPFISLKMGAQSGRQLARETAELRIRINDAFQGLAELLIYNAMPRYLLKISDAAHAVIELQRRMTHLSGLTTAVMICLNGFAVLTTLYIGVELLNTGSMTGTSLALAVFAVMAAFEAFAPLPGAYQYLSRTRESARRLLEIVQHHPLVSFPEKSAAAPERFDIRFEKVCFGYDKEQPVLQHVDFELREGKKLAILGATGSGKSTLINLLVRFWNPSSGRILLGRNTIDTYSEADLRSFIAAAPQEAGLFNATIRENLLMARPGAADEELRQVLQAVRMLDFVDRLPEREHTWIGESGSRLSGGQIRRLAIARALLKNAPILVLDEPTEGLDATTEKRMMQGLSQYMSGRTVIMITHRLTNLDWMDEIVILEKGRIVERGCHDELLSGKTPYAAMHSRPDS